MNYLSGKDKKNLMEKLPKGYVIDKKDSLACVDNVVVKDDLPFLIIHNSFYLPHLQSVPSTYPSVFIDRGAIPFLMKGADMMRPGITQINGSFEKGDVVVIKDEEHEKLLGIGFSLVSSSEMESLKTGKVIQTYHYFNDSYYSR